MTPDQTPKPLNPLERYLFSIALKKVSLALTKFATAILGSVAVQAALKKYGIAVDPNVLIPALVALFVTGLEFAHDYLKLKTGWTWL